MFDRLILLNFYTDSKSLFDAIVVICPTTKNCLIVDFSLVCETFEPLEIVEDFWLPSKDNPADALNKKSLLLALADLGNTNMLQLKAKK